MKNIDIRDYNGLLNLFGETDDFFNTYCYMKKVFIFKIIPENKEDKILCGLLLGDENEMRFLKVNIPTADYLQLTVYSDAYAKPVHGPMESLHMVTNFYGINMICAYVQDFDGIGDCNASLVMEQNNRVFSVDADINDIVSFSMMKLFPIFIKRELFDKFGIDKSEIKSL